MQTNVHFWGSLLKFASLLLLLSVTSLAASAIPPPYDPYIGSDSFVARPIKAASEDAYFGTDGIVKELGHSGAVPLIASDEAQRYLATYPKYKAGSLYPAEGSIYQVVDYLKIPSRLPDGTVEADRVDRRQLPRPIRRAENYENTWAVPLRATVSFGKPAGEPPWSKTPHQFSTHIHLTKITPADQKNSTATVEVWSDGEKKRRTEMLQRNDKLQAGRWTFKVTNIVPPQDLPPNESFEGGHVVGWVEFFLVDVEEKRNQAEEARSGDVQ